MPHSPVFQPAAFTDLPGWSDDDHDAAFQAFARSAQQVLIKPYRSGSLGLSVEAFGPAFAEARDNPPARGKARAFFEKHFRPARVIAEDGGQGFVTGFYEPVLAASPVRTPLFAVPLLSRPADLVDMDEENRPASLDPSLAFARRDADGALVEYHDRAAIEAGALDGAGLELAWLADPVDVFFIHVQGAARLVMPDGAEKRVTYAAKSGHRFSGPGRFLVDSGEIAPEAVSMQAIRDWLGANPDRIAEVLHRNRSYIFFREAPVGHASLGPVAAAKVQLTPGRSLAVDRMLHTFGTPFFVSGASLTAFGGQSFRRLMIAQDTGSAIVGSARGDLFAGSGDAAGQVAGGIRHTADFFALLPVSVFANGSS